MKGLLYSLVVLFCTFQLRGQDSELPVGFIVLDSFTVTAVRAGLDINDLIEIMQYDSTLYIAFNNLHFTNYSYDNEIQTFRKDRVEASRIETITQSWDGQCRTQTIDKQLNEGSFKNKKGKEKYYTADLFNRTFYTPYKVCNEQRKSNWKEVLYSDKKEGHLAAIKRVVFNPGSPVNLPIIGKKFALFDESMKKYYNYSIDGKTINGHKCYQFTIEVKPEFSGSRKAVIVRKLTTTFRTIDFQVIQRDYTLFYQGSLVKVDIKMNIDLKDTAGRFYPDAFQYDGSWKVPTKKMEDMKLQTNFKIN